MSVSYTHLARDYIGIARSLGVSEAMCDDIGIEVTRLNAKLLIAALGDYAYPVVPHNFREAMQFASSNRIVVMGGTEPAPVSYTHLIKDVESHSFLSRSYRRKKGS